MSGRGGGDQVIGVCVCVFFFFFFFVFFGSAALIMRLFVALSFAV